ncbi:AAA family ATPase [Cystobacter fuscus]
MREDDSERAVLAGLLLVRKLPALLRKKLPFLPSSLAVSVGVRTDRVAMEQKAPGSREQTLNLHGEAPSLAAWFARQAGPGEVVIGEATWRLVRGGFETEPLGTRTFEGLAASLSVGLYRVLRETRATTRFERARAVGGLTPLVGRGRELGRLLELWNQTRSGRGSSVLISGEAGLGKSRLIQELSERVPEHEATRIQVQCSSRFNARAHSLIVELLQGSVRLSPEGTPGQHQRELESQLGAWGLSAEQAWLIGHLLALPLPEGSPLHLLTPERRRDRAFEALCDLLLNKARERPVLVTVEDLHWASSAHLDFLGTLLEHLERAGLLVVLSARPEFRPPWPPRPWNRALVLTRLPAAQALDLVKEVVRGRGVREDVLQQVVKRTDGNPLFIEELTRMVLDRSPSSSTASPTLPHSIPVTLLELLQARLDTLRSRQKALAQLCAVVGRGFTYSLLSVLAEHSGATLRRELSGLVDAGLLQEQRVQGTPGYEFRHALIQEAAYESLARGPRRRYHLRIARALAEHSPEEVRQRPEVLAHHYTEAGVIEPAIQYWAQAGRQASLQSANQEALGYLSRALELLGRLPDSSERLRQELEIQVALGIPLIHTQGYRSSQVERTFARIRALFFQMGEALPRLELAYWGIYSYHFARAEYGLAHELALWLVDVGGRQHDQELLAQGCRMMATDFFFWGRLREALDYCERAIACSRFDLEKHRELARRHWANPLTTALSHTSMVCSVLGHPELARQRAREALALAQRIGHPHTMAYALTYSAVASQLRREVSLALEWAEQAIAISSERGYWLWWSWSNIIRLWALSERGQTRELLDELEQAIERWQARGVQAGMPYICGVLSEFHLKLGQVQRGLSAVQRGLHWMERTGERSYDAELHRLRGELLRLAGRPLEAKHSLFRAIALARWQSAGLFELRATVGLARLRRDMGWPEEGARLLTRLLARLGPNEDSPDFQEARALLDQTPAQAW